MPSRRLVLSFVILWWTLGIVLLVLSIRTAQAGIASRGSMVPHAALLGVLEAIAALLFLIPRTLRGGAAGLLFTIAVAFLLHAFRHQVRWDLLVYAAAVIFVWVHGPVTWKQLRAAS